VLYHTQMAQTLGDWTLGEALGQGGQGHVFRATRTVEGAASPIFALKRLSKTANPKARARFVREIEALKRINHAGVVKPVDHSTPSDDQPFYVMPYEDGITPLSKLIWPESGGSGYKQKAVPCLDFIANCADAVTAAHAAEVIHRDLKPANILVRRDGSPLIIDFGCCLMLDDDHAITLTDEGVGARNFMAPECEAGTEGDTSARSDTYSLGKVLWCMFTGERAFAREKPGFTNKIATNAMPDDPIAGFIVEAMLQSVRRDALHRLKTAEDFAKVCRSFSSRIRAGGAHVSFVAVRCPACRSTNIKASNRIIDGPLHFDAGVLVRTGNNPQLTAKFCFDCGSVTPHDTRPMDAYKKRLAEAD